MKKLLSGVLATSLLFSTFTVVTVVEPVSALVFQSEHRGLVDNMPLGIFTKKQALSLFMGGVLWKIIQIMQHHGHIFVLKSKRL